MSLISTLDIGPVVTAPGNFSVSRSAPSGTKGLRSVTFVGEMDRLVAAEVEELVVNPAARQTIAGVSGVPADIVAGSSMLSTYTGFYLLQGFDSSPDGIRPQWPYVNFTLTGILFPETS